MLLSTQRPYGVGILQCNFDRKPNHEELEKNNWNPHDESKAGLADFTNVDSWRRNNDFERSQVSE